MLGIVPFNYVWLEKGKKKKTSKCECRESACTRQRRVEVRVWEKAWGARRADGQAQNSHAKSGCSWHDIVD